jgi:hypothetical protein
MSPYSFPKINPKDPRQNQSQSSLNNTISSGAMMSTQNIKVLLQRYLEKRSKHWYGQDWCKLIGPSFNDDHRILTDNPIKMPEEAAAKAAERNQESTVE